MPSTVVHRLSYGDWIGVLVRTGLLQRAQLAVEQDAGKEVTLRSRSRSTSSSRSACR